MTSVRPMSRTSNFETVLLLPEGALEMIKDQLEVGKYLARKQKFFLYSGISVIVLRVFVMLCWLLVGHFHNRTAATFMAAGSIAEIASASFLITIGCKPMRWVASRVLALSIFCAMGNISAGFASLALLVRTGVQNQVIFGWLTIFFHIILCAIFTSTAAYSGYALKCSICCTPEEDNDNTKATNDELDFPLNTVNARIPVSVPRQAWENEGSRALPGSIA